MQWYALLLVSAPPGQIDPLRRLARKRARRIFCVRRAFRVNLAFGGAEERFFSENMAKETQIASFAILIMDSFIAVSHSVIKATIQTMIL